MKSELSTIGEFLRIHTSIDRSIFFLVPRSFLSFFCCCHVIARSAGRRRRATSKGKSDGGFHSIIILSEMNISTSRRRPRLITGTADPLQITMLARAHQRFSLIALTCSRCRRHLRVIFRNYRGFTSSRLNIWM